MSFEVDAPVPSMNERTLLRAYGEVERAEPCGCGVVIVCGPDEVAERLAEHVATPRHQSWRAWRETEA